jgi:hypothetical protein
MYDPTMDNLQQQQHHVSYPEEDLGDAPRVPVTLYDPTVQHSAPAAAEVYTSQHPPGHHHEYDGGEGGGMANKWEPTRTNGPFVQKLKPKKKISKKWQRRLYWYVTCKSIFEPFLAFLGSLKRDAANLKNRIVPLGIIAIVFAILFEVYKDDFERWIKPLSDWLKAREAWSWVIPTVTLVILSFPPLFGHEIVQLVVGLAYPLGVALGIACAGAVLGEAACL